MSGLIHVYTGNGKGKTTAAAGLSVRAFANGKKVFIVQFLKTSDSGEISFIKSLKNEAFQVFRFEEPHGFIGGNNAEAADMERLLKESRKALEFIYKTLTEKECDMLILDEIICAYTYSLVSRREIEDIIRLKDKECELVLTGRGAPKWLIEAADYVTEMKAVKHPYERGITARRGIEF